MARLTEYNFDFLKEYKNINVIYGLYTEKEGVKYIGYSKNVYLRFYNHLRNHESDSNTKKINWIDKNKKEIKIKLLSINPTDWESEEINLIKSYSKNELLNICEGGKNNIRKKSFENMTCECHLLEANKSLKFLNKYFKLKGNPKKYKLLSKDDIKKICDFDINKK